MRFVLRGLRDLGDLRVEFACPDRTAAAEKPCPIHRKNPDLSTRSRLSNAEPAEVSDNAEPRVVIGSHRPSRRPNLPDSSTRIA